MNILITGGTGFIGSALCEFLLEKGHQITVKTRYPALASSNVVAIKNLSEINEHEKFDVVINLAGEPIANKRWSAAQKHRIVNSRLDSTKALIAYFKSTQQTPAVFISGSAIGFYGIDSTSGAENLIITEDAEADSSFSSQLCLQWEACALQAESLGIRTCLLRTGIVLGKNGGALSKMILPFKLGLGGRIGSGNQWMPWIHIDDLISMIDYCIENPILQGPVNATAENPVTNSQFTIALGKALRRPTILPMPAFIIHFLMGEMGKELLLSGKKVHPIKATSAGFRFKYQKLDSALANIFCSVKFR